MSAYQLAWLLPVVSGLLPPRQTGRIARRLIPAPALCREECPSSGFTSLPIGLPHKQQLLGKAGTRQHAPATGQLVSRGIWQSYRPLSYHGLCTGANIYWARPSSGRSEDANEVLAPDGVLQNESSLPRLKWGSGATTPARPPQHRQATHQGACVSQTCRVFIHTAAAT